MPRLTGSWNEFDGATVAVRVGISRQELLRLRSARRPIPQPVDLTGLLDTGAQVTCIDPSAVRGLGLTLYGVAPVNIPAAGGLTGAVQYAASLTLIHPSGNSLDDMVVPDMPLTEVNIGQLGYQLLIGRDVLVLCTFYFDGPGLSFTLDY